MIVVKKKKGKGRKNASAQIVGGHYEPPQPGPFLSSFRIDKVLRYQAASAGTGLAITTFDLLTLLNMGVTTTSIVSLIQSVKVKRIQIWGPPPSALTPVTVSVEFQGGNTSGAYGTNSVTKSDTSMGSSYPAYISANTPKDSFSSMWIQNNSSISSTNWALLTFPSGALVDLHVSFILSQSMVGMTTAVTTSVVGTLYMLHLDGDSGILVPVSFPTTT